MHIYIHIVYVQHVHMIITCVQHILYIYAILSVIEIHMDPWIYTTARKCEPSVALGYVLTSKAKNQKRSEAWQGSQVGGICRAECGKSSHLKSGSHQGIHAK